MSDETDDEFQKFVAGIDPNELKREELSERWRVQVRAKEEERLKQNKPVDLSKLTDAELREYTRKNYGF